jgi:hypothetical protein
MNKEAMLEEVRPVLEQTIAILDQHKRNPGKLHLDGLSYKQLRTVASWVKRFKEGSLDKYLTQRRHCPEVFWQTVFICPEDYHDYHEVKLLKPHLNALVEAWVKRPTSLRGKKH